MDVLDVQLESIHAFRRVWNKVVAVVVHGAGSDLTVSWPVMWVEWSWGDIGGSVKGGIVGSSCREGVSPDGRDDRYDTLGGSSRRLSEFNKDDFVVDQFWMRRRV